MGRTEKKPGLILWISYGNRFYLISHDSVLSLFFCVQEAKMSEELALMKHDLDAFRYNLERKESSIMSEGSVCCFF